MIKSIQQDVKEYGKQGDKTLEFIGVNISKLGYEEYKCYRFWDKENGSAVPYLKQFEQCSSLKRLDMQEISKNMFRASYKVVDCENLKADLENILAKNIQTTITVKEIIEINDFLKKELETKEAPLCVVGCKAYKNGEIQQLKIYYKLKVFDKNKEPFLASEKTYFKILQRLKKKYEIKTQEIKKVEKIYRFLKENNYEPMQIGFNITNEIDSIKYYFKKSNDREEKQGMAVIHKLLNFIGINVDLSVKGMFDTIDEQNLVLKGGAVSYNMSNKMLNSLNIYFVEK